jgi:hypothetical protein
MADKIVTVENVEYHLSDDDYNKMIKFLEDNATAVIEKELVVDIEPTDGVHTVTKEEDEEEE